ncbi:Hsp20/alpha crystallin family protein [Salinarimonas sp. NSM]|uniref:Hsp20/alpha crystallin family protein n=1 Tax=Salinarimonas sp. NSM TaxID=3458003 RepID=UPI004035620E
MRRPLPTNRRDDAPLTALQRDMERLIGRVGRSLPAFFGESGFPALDVAEKDDVVTITAELPGVPREAVTVEAADGGIVIRGEKKDEREDEDETRWLLERSYGVFVRRVPLSFEPDPGAIEASFKEGVLTVRVPRPAEAKVAPKTVEIRAG